MLEALIAEFEAIASDDEARVIVLAGVGAALSAGHDLKEMQAHRNDCDRGRSYYVKSLRARCSALMQAIVALPKPVIAAVEGVATAAGCQLVAACDLAVAGEKARFGLSGVNFGLFCSTPLVAVGRAISRKRAMEMAMTGQLLHSAEDATSISVSSTAWFPRAAHSRKRRRWRKPSPSNPARHWRSASAPSTPRSSSRSTRPMPWPPWR